MNALYPCLTSSLFQVLPYLAMSFGPYCVVLIKPCPEIGREELLTPGLQHLLCQLDLDYVHLLCEDDLLYQCGAFNFLYTGLNELFYYSLQLTLCFSWDQDL